MTNSFPNFHIWKFKRSIISSTKYKPTKNSLWKIKVLGLAFRILYYVMCLMLTQIHSHNFNLSHRIRRKINNLKTEELRKNIFACLFSVHNTISSHVTWILVHYMYAYRIEKNYFLKSIWNCAVWDSRRLKDVFLMSLFFTIADFKQENVYFDSFFWLWNYIHLHNFFSNNKSLLSSTRTSYINVWNNKHWNVSERSNFLLLLEHVIWETTWLA